MESAHGELFTLEVPVGSISISEGTSKISAIHVATGINIYSRRTVYELTHEREFEVWILTEILGRIC